jgi:hypothetical protein
MYLLLKRMYVLLLCSICMFKAMLLLQIVILCFFLYLLLMNLMQYVTHTHTHTHTYNMYHILVRFSVNKKR